jgi:hypothetical protein
MVARIYGYLRRWPYRLLEINNLRRWPYRLLEINNTPKVPRGTVTKPHSTKDPTQWAEFYPRAMEEIDPEFPNPLGQLLTSGIILTTIMLITNTKGVMGLASWHM